jgi:hypothetical protein
VRTYGPELGERAATREEPLMGGHAILTSYCKVSCRSYVYYGIIHTVCHDPPEALWLVRQSTNYTSADIWCFGVFVGAIISS